LETSAWRYSTITQVSGSIKKDRDKMISTLPTLSVHYQGILKLINSFENFKKEIGVLRTKIDLSKFANNDIFIDRGLFFSKRLFSDDQVESSFKSHSEFEDMKIFGIELSSLIEEYSGGYSILASLEERGERICEYSLEKGEVETLTQFVQASSEAISDYK
jgi:hypothetical protein